MVCSKFSPYSLPDSSFQSHLPSLIPYSFLRSHISPNRTTVMAFLIPCLTRNAQIHIAILVMGVLMLSVTSKSKGDLIKLKNGGEIRGLIQEKRQITTADELSIETLSGVLILVARDDVEFISVRSVKIEEYEVRRKNLPATSLAHWEMAEWCRKQHLSSQRIVHLKAVIELVPDHQEAHRALGHRLVNGKWMSRDEEMESQGLVKYKGRWITPQELEVLEKSEAELEEERKWHKQVRVWITWLGGSKLEQQQAALSQLRQLKEPAAVAGLTRMLQKHKNRQYRLLFVQILSQIPGEKPVIPLVKQSLLDADQEIRYAARSGISEDQYPFAFPEYIRSLKSDQNVVVKRAGAALQQMGNESAIPYLIDALVTTHRYRVLVNDTAGTLGFQTNGNVAVGNSGQTALPPQIEMMLRTGQLPNGVIVNAPQASTRKKVVVVKYEHRNEPVLLALQKISGENFGYDERTWKLWYIAHKKGLVNQ